MDSLSRIPNPIIDYAIRNGAKGATSAPAWASIVKLSGGHPATVPATWQVADGIGGRLDLKSLEFSGQKCHMPYRIT